MKAVVKTVREKVRNVAETWRSCFFRRGEWRYGQGVKHELLVALGPDPVKEDVDRIIGLDDWTTILCDGCKERVERVVMVGQEPGYDSATATLCARCLDHAVQAMRESEENER